MKTSRLRLSPFSLVALPLCFAGFGLGCASDKTDKAPKPCCEQPQIPAGTPAFTVLADDVTGPSDGQRVIMRIALREPVKRDAVYPVLHTLYRHAMKRSAFEPIHFVADVYANDQDAVAGGDDRSLARITRAQSDQGPRCDNRIPYDFTEQVDRAFAASLGRAPEEDLNDTCRLAPAKVVARPDDGFANRPSYEVDAATKTVAVTFPYLEMGKDEFVKELRLNAALTYWIELTTSLFRKVGEVDRVSYAGTWKGETPVKITVTRAQFETHLAALQEEIAAHAAVTFQTLGMGRSNDASALKEQEAFKSKTYKTALARLPKGAVALSAKLK
jgi:hypothetical protein